MTDQPRFNENAVRVEILGDLELAAAAAAQRARRHRLWASETDLDRTAHWTEVGRQMELLRSAIADRKLIERLEDEQNDDSYQSQYDVQCAWHTLRLYAGPHPFDDGLVEQYDTIHPGQCSLLPPGAVCWFIHDPYQHWWPVDHGTYRLRATQWARGGNEGGPNIEQGMDIQVWDTTTCTWTDWHGTSRGEQEAAAAPAEPEPAAPQPAAVPHAFGDFAIVELMGHVKIAGRVTETTYAGAPVLLVEIPNPDGTIKATKYVTSNSLYAITPCDEETARAVANPASWRYTAALEAGNSGQEEDDYDEGPF